MARIRTIKPEFWTNEKVMSCNALTRLLFIGMWNFADDYGRMIYAPGSIKARVFPNDQLSTPDMRDMINELCSNGLLMLYSANDKEYIEITGWDHQKIDKRQTSKIPGPFESGSAINGAIPPTPADLPRLTPTPAPVMEGKGEEGKEDIRAVAKATRPNASFETFWEARPRRKGADPKEPARKQYEIALKSFLSDAEYLLAALKRYATIEAEHVGTPYLPQMVKWLRDKRYFDYPEVAIQPQGETDWDAVCSSFVRFGRWSKWGGPEPGDVGCRCPPEILRKHGIGFGTQIGETMQSAIPKLAAM